MLKFIPKVLKTGSHIWRIIALSWIYACVFALFLTSCESSGDYRLKGTMSDGSETTLRLVVFTPEGVENIALASRDGKFEISLNTSHKDKDLPAYFEIYSHDYNLLGIAAVSPGKETKVTVNPAGFKYFKTDIGKADTELPADKFNKSLTDWLEDTKSIDNKAIEDFITANPDNQVSYALLSAAYDASLNPAKSYTLLNSISPSVRQTYYNPAFTDLMAQFSKNPDFVEPIRLWCSADSFITLEPTEHRRTFIAFVTDEDVQRSDSVVSMLQRYAKAAGKDKKSDLIVEHNLANDTFAWKRALKDDVRQRLTKKELPRLDTGKEGRVSSRRGMEATSSAKAEDKTSPQWISVWSGAGVSAPGADRFAITALPYYVVADSMARIKYMGSSPIEADSAFRSLKK